MKGKPGMTRRAAALLAALLGGCATTAAETARHAWFEVRSPRFRAVTDADPALARALLEDLERFHRVILHKTTAEDRQGLPPLRIVLAKDRASFAALVGADAQTAGRFVATSRGNFALLPAGAEREAGSALARHVLFHEYTHYVIAVQGARVPSWYNEGLAEYMATTAFRGDGSYTLGCPPIRTANAQPLSWLPLQRVMEAENVASLVRGAKGGLHAQREGRDAYLQSWYAVHYFNQSSDHQRRLGEYLRLWAAGAPPAEAVQSALGMSYAELDAELRRYAAGPEVACLENEPAQPLARPHVEVRPLSESDAHYEVGDLLLAISGPTDTALALLKRAAAADPGHVRALAAIARAHMQRAARAGDDGELKEAQRWLARARKLAPDDAEVLTLTGRLETFRAERLGQQGDPAASEVLSAARTAFRKAIRKDELFAEAYIGLGETYLIEDTGSEEAIVVLEAAAYLLPLDTGVALALAKVHVGRSQPVQAIPAIEYVLRYGRNARQRDEARELIEQLRAAAAVPQEAAVPP